MSKIKTFTMNTFTLTFFAAPNTSTAPYCAKSLPSFAAPSTVIFLNSQNWSSTHTTTAVAAAITTTTPPPSPPTHKAGLERKTLLLGLNLLDLLLDVP